MSGRSAALAVIGGSGLYRLLDDAEEVSVTTPFGEPSDSLAVGDLAGRSVAFLPRHGRGHTVPPHRINHRANLWALRRLGVERVLAPCAVGSLRADRAPGSLVVCDQLVNLSSGRADTYFDGPEVAHLSAPDPYCAELRPLAAAAARRAGLDVHEGGTVAVVNGPRFSTRAESRLFASWGIELLSMTQYPEALLARELGMCYVALALVTDFDSGLEGAPEVAPVTQEEVVAVFARSIEGVRRAIVELVRSAPLPRSCGCAAAAPAAIHP